MPFEGESSPSAWAWAREQAETYERSGGTEANTLEGKPVVVLTSRGACSGKLRKTALIRVEQEGRYSVAASKGGSPEHPA